VPKQITLVGHSVDAQDAMFPPEGPGQGPQKGKNVIIIDQQTGDVTIIPMLQAVADDLRNKLASTRIEIAQAIPDRVLDTTALREPRGT
jgi:hypothetical protein